jgi:hypothetical protein
VLHELQEEKDMNKCLLENQQLWQKRVTALETSIKDLTESKEKVSVIDDDDGDDDDEEEEDGDDDWW